MYKLETINFNFRKLLFTFQIDNLTLRKKVKNIDYFQNTLNKTQDEIIVKQQSFTTISIGPYIIKDQLIQLPKM